MQENLDSARVFDSRNLIVYLYKWRIPLLGISILAAILAAIFSGSAFVDPKYKSSVTVFPTTTNSLSKALLPQQFASRGQDILEFGAEEEAEQLLQILNSDEIRDRVIEKYNLAQHYGIDSSSKFLRTELYDTFDDNISFERTEFMSVEINVLDTDPDTAALIANDIVLLLDEAKNRIQKERAQQGLKIIEGEYEELKREVDRLEDSLTVLRYKGVHDYEGQSGVYSEQLAFEIASNGEDSWQARGIQVKLDTLAKYGGPYVSVRDELQYLRGQLVQIKTKYDQAKVDVEQSLPASFKVNMAYPAEKKSYPTRWLIVVVAAMGAFVSTLIVILIRDTIKNANIDSK
ncbi:MAG: Wzz/FepE/Etk N-terminal domain-containing protein [Owenweeksia sp.]